MQTPMTEILSLYFTVNFCQPQLQTFFPINFDGFLTWDESSRTEFPSLSSFLHAPANNISMLSGQWYSWLFRCDSCCDFINVCRDALWGWLIISVVNFKGQHIFLIIWTWDFSFLPVWNCCDLFLCTVSYILNVTF